MLTKRQSSDGLWSYYNIKHRNQIWSMLNWIVCIQDSSLCNQIQATFFFVINITIRIQSKWSKWLLTNQSILYLTGLQELRKKWFYDAIITITKCYFQYVNCKGIGSTKYYGIISLHILYKSTNSYCFKRFITNTSNTNRSSTKIYSIYEKL